MNAPADLNLDRQRYLGGSDAAAVLGVSPWATPLDVFLEKTGQAVKEIDPAREKLFKRGKRLEPIVIDMLIEDLGIKVTKRSTPQVPNRYVDPEHDFLAAEIDFEWEVTAEVAALVADSQPDIADLIRSLVGTTQNGEIKTVHVFAAAKFGDEGTDETPVEYAAQAAHGLMITGRKLTMFGVLVGADNLSVYWIARDEEVITEMRRREVRFWTEHVLAGIPPDPVNLPDVIKLFRRTPSAVVEASEDVVTLVEELKEVKQAAQAAEERELEIKFQIGKHMLGEAAIDLERKKNGAAKSVVATINAKPGSHVLTYCGRELLVVNLQQQIRLDNDRIREEYPEVAAECAKQISFYRFDQPRAKRR